MISRGLLQIGSMPSPTGDLRQMVPAPRLGLTGVTELPTGTVSVRVRDRPRGCTRLRLSTGSFHNIFYNRSD